MQLALTPEEAAFRDELRTFYTTKIPAELRERNRLGLPIVANGPRTEVAVPTEGKAKYLRLTQEQ